MDTATFVEHFTADKPVVFAFHDYPRAIHDVVYGRPNVQRFHVRGFNEEGTTTALFDIVVLNGMRRYHLCLDIINTFMYSHDPLSWLTISHSLGQ